jgi:hypothetical protein
MRIHRIGVVSTALLTLAVSAGTAAPSSAATAARRSVATATAEVLMKAYDPQDVLGLPGDTHALEVSVHVGPPVPRTRIWMLSYTCGPHDPASLPWDIGCEQVEERDLPLTNATAEHTGDTIRVRSEAPNAIELALTGREPRPFVSREWWHADGRYRESGRTDALEYIERVTATGTLGSLSLLQFPEWVQWSAMSSDRTVTRRGAGPLLPVPTVPTPGTKIDPWVAVARGSLDWTREASSAGGGTGIREVEVGRLDFRKGSVLGDVDDLVWPQVTYQRCAPGERPLWPGDTPGQGRCRIVRGFIGSDNQTFDIDPSAGTAHITVELVDDDPATANVPLEFTWHGRRPVAIKQVDTERYDSIARGWTTTRTGVRWQIIRATGTSAGDRADHVKATSFTAYLEKREWADDALPQLLRAGSG